MACSIQVLACRTYLGPHDGSLRLSVARKSQFIRSRNCRALEVSLTFQVEQYVGLIILEHLSNQLNIHVLHIDVLVIFMSIRVNSTNELGCAFIPGVSCS